MKVYKFNLFGYGVPESVSIFPVFKKSKTEVVGRISSTANMQGLNVINANEVAGEIVNIDAITGGFNFQNAWTSGFIVANAITS
jgi:hypothetical protein